MTDIQWFDKFNFTLSFLEIKTIFFNDSMSVNASRHYNGTEQDCLKMTNVVFAY